MTFAEKNRDLNIFCAQLVAQVQFPTLLTIGITKEFEFAQVAVSRNRRLPNLEKR